MSSSLTRRLGMNKKYKCKILKFFFCVGIVVVHYSCGSTTEFLAEPDFRLEYPEYQKSNFHQVELTYHRPKSPFKICGEIFLRNFQEYSDSKEIENALKKEAFTKKLDGVWIRNLSKEEISPFLIISKNQSGMILNYQEIGKEVAKIQATGFRYKQDANKK